MIALLWAAPLAELWLLHLWQLWCGACGHSPNRHGTCRTCGH